MKTLLLFVLVIPLTCTETRYLKGATCRLSIDYKKGDLKEPQPLLLENTDKPTFLLPKEKRILAIPTNTSILLACPGKSNSFKLVELKQTVEAICMHDKTFLIDGKPYEFAQFTCKTLPEENVRKSALACLKNHTRYDIGFTVKKHFISLIEICRDEKTLRTYYSKHVIPKESMSYQSTFPRPYWKYGKYYPGYNMGSIYKASSQVGSVESLVGSAELASEYIRPGDQQYLNRGHLAAKADFIYGSQQTATFWLLNTAPQWASFNSGNWMVIESSVRYFASLQNVDLVVYTGVHGVTTLRDVDGQQQELFLHVNETEKAIPVPRFYWKIMHDTVRNLATAFVGLNEPYAEEITKDMYLCSDISKDFAFSWVSWDPINIERGVSYICSVEDLRKVVPTIPLLGEVGVLV